MVYIHVLTVKKLTFRKRGMVMALSVSRDLSVFNNIDIGHLCKNKTIMN